MTKNKPICLDDGFRPDLIEGANFDGLFEIPCLESLQGYVLPKKVIPFSQRNRTTDFSELIVFYEKDRLFKEVLETPEKYIQDFKRFSGGITTPDSSLYRDSPLSVQIANTYRNRVIGYFYQKRGITVVPTIRWGDERSYTKSIFPEAFCFLGVPKNSVVSIGTYGCIQGKENKYYFEAGLDAMLSILHPCSVIVYGSMPAPIFGQYMNFTEFVHFEDWISTIKGIGGKDGVR